MYTNLLFAQTKKTAVKLKGCKTEEFMYYLHEDDGGG